MMLKGVLAFDWETGQLIPLSGRRSDTIGVSANEWNGVIRMRFVFKCEIIDERQHLYKKKLTIAIQYCHIMFWLGHKNVESISKEINVK